MMPYFVYIIYSVSSDKYYIGSSDNPLLRLQSHNTSVRNTFTSKHRPWMMKAYFEAGDTRAAAIRVEKYVKSLKSRERIKELIERHGDAAFLTALISKATKNL